MPCEVAHTELEVQGDWVEGDNFDICLLEPEHTYFCVGQYMTTEAKRLVSYLVETAKSRNPDLYDLKVHDDFHPYGVLDLINQTIICLIERMGDEDIEQNYRFLEALSVFMALEPNWTDCKEEDLKRLDKLYGSLVFTILGQLHALGELDGIHHPSLQHLLRNINRCGRRLGYHMGSLTSYQRLSKAVAKRLFGISLEVKRGLEIARMEEWADTLTNPKDRNRTMVILHEMKERSLETVVKEEDWELWYQDSQPQDEVYADPNYDFGQAWHEYKSHTDLCPTMFDSEAPSWSVNEWTSEERSPFELDGL